MEKPTKGVGKVLVGVKNGMWQPERTSMYSEVDPVSEVGFT